MRQWLSRLLSQIAIIVEGKLAINQVRGSVCYVGRCWVQRAEHNEFPIAAIAAAPAVAAIAVAAGQALVTITSPWCIGGGQWSYRTPGTVGRATIATIDSCITTTDILQCLQ